MLLVFTNKKISVVTVLYQINFEVTEYKKEI